ncbi:MAG: glycosyltransferase [Pirellulales bacterium]|nr:glycosyltransferase [Pirellulales bacterium]
MPLAKSTGRFEGSFPRTALRRSTSSASIKNTSRGERRAGFAASPQHKTVLVVPCYDEALRLDLGRIRQFLSRRTGLELLFVNDGSTDATGTMLDELVREFPRQLRVLHLNQNSGKAEAVRQGMLALLEGTNAPEFVGFLDADFATVPESLVPFRDLLATRDDLQGVIGVRLRLAGHRIKREVHRHWLSRIFARLASATIGVRFTDTQCGAKLFRASPELRTALHRPFLSRWIFDVELLSRLASQFAKSGQPGLDWSIYEYPLDAWSEIGGSKLRWRDYGRAIWDLAQIWWENTWNTSFYTARNSPRDAEINPASENLQGSSNVSWENTPPDSESQAAPSANNTEESVPRGTVPVQVLLPTPSYDEESLVEETLADTQGFDESATVADLLTPALRERPEREELAAAEEALEEEWDNPKQESSASSVHKPDWQQAADRHRQRHERRKNKKNRRAA